MFFHVMKVRAQQQILSHKIRSMKVFLIADWIILTVTADLVRLIISHLFCPDRVARHLKKAIILHQISSTTSNLLLLKRVNAVLQSFILRIFDKEKMFCQNENHPRKLQQRILICSSTHRNEKLSHFTTEENFDTWLCYKTKKKEREVSSLRNPTEYFLLRKTIRF